MTRSDDEREKQGRDCGRGVETGFHLEFSLTLSDEYAPEKVVAAAAPTHRSREHHQRRSDFKLTAE